MAQSAAPHLRFLKPTPPKLYFTSIFFLTSLFFIVFSLLTHSFGYVENTAIVIVGILALLVIYYLFACLLTKLVQPSLLQTIIAGIIVSLILDRGLQLSYGHHLFDIQYQQYQPTTFNVVLGCYKQEFPWQGALYCMDIGHRFVAVGIYSIIFTLFSYFLSYILLTFIAMLKPKGKRK
jgi:hypothetical protein